MTTLRLGSRYQLEERIGAGGVGVVWRGSDVSTGTTYAIKLLRSALAQNPAMMARFVRERTALLRFRHPHAVLLHDMVIEGDRLALVMDYITGGDLDELRQRRGGTLPVAEAAALTAQIGAALAAAHAAGIVHQNLKPANVLLESGEVRVTDFGIEGVTGEPSALPGPTAGSVAYLAPEIINGAEPSPACDVYAVGVMLYELLAGRTPSGSPARPARYGQAQTSPPRPAGVPDALWALMTTCLDQDPGGRPAAAELASGLADPALTDAERAVVMPVGTAWDEPPLADPVRADPVLAEPELVEPERTGPAGAVSAPTGWERAEPLDPWADSRWGQPASPDRAFAESSAGVLAAAGEAAAQATTKTPAGPPESPGSPRTGAAGAPSPPRGRRSRRLAWAGGVLAVLAVAGVLAAALNRPPAATTASTAGPGTVGASAAAAGHAGGPVGPVSGVSHSAAAPRVPGGTPGAPPSGTAGPSASPTARASGRAAATAGPASGPSLSAAATTTASATPPLSSAAPVPLSRPTPTSAPPLPAPTLPAPPLPTPPTPSPIPSPTLASSPVHPANTAWQCGPAEPATLLKNGTDTGQTLQACIRINNGALDLQGILTGTVPAWAEQVVLVLTGADQQDGGDYISAPCIQSTCSYTVLEAPPSDGEWTVLPEWARYGNYQSTGAEAGFVDF